LAALGQATVAEADCAATCFLAAVLPACRDTETTENQACDERGRYESDDLLGTHVHLQREQQLRSPRESSSPVCQRRVNSV